MRKRIRDAPPPAGREPPALPADARNQAPRSYRIWRTPAVWAFYLSFSRRLIPPLRRFAAGTGGFLRLGAPRCGSRARPDASRRRVRFAGYCASVTGAERRRRQATNGSDSFKFRAAARTGSGAVAAAPRCGSRARRFASRRRVRFAGNYASVTPDERGAPTPASDQRERFLQVPRGSANRDPRRRGRERLPQFRAAARTGSRAAAGAVAAGILGRLSGLRGVDEIAFGGILSRNERRSVADSINQTCSGVAGSVP